MRHRRFVVSVRETQTGREDTNTPNHEYILSCFQEHLQGPTALLLRSTVSKAALLLSPVYDKAYSIDSWHITAPGSEISAVTSPKVPVSDSVSQTTVAKPLLPCTSTYRSSQPNVVLSKDENKCWALTSSERWHHHVDTSSANRDDHSSLSTAPGLTHTAARLSPPLESTAAWTSGERV